MKIRRIESVSRSAHGSTRTLLGAPGRDRDRVGDDDLLEARRAQVLEGVAREDACVAAA